LSEKIRKILQFLQIQNADLVVSGWLLDFSPHQDEVTVMAVVAVGKTAAMAAMKFYDAVAVENVRFFVTFTTIGGVKVRRRSGFASGKSVQKPDTYHIRCSEGIGYILEEHFVTLGGVWH